MIREVEREIGLAAFSLEWGDLELIWQRILKLFEPNLEIRKKISIKIPSEKLTFESLEELREYAPLHGIVTNFSIEMRQGKRSVILTSGSLFSITPTLKVEGESDIWCAGAIEAVKQVVSQRRVWYSWLVYIPFTFIFFLLGIFPFLKVGPFERFPDIPRTLLFTWAITTLFFGYFSRYREQVIPAASIVFTRELGFIRRYAGEIGLLLAVLAILVSIYMYIFPYGT